MSPRRTIALAALALAAAVPSACDDASRRVVLYVSADSHVARPVLQAFEDRTGVGVDVVSDTEAQKTTGLSRRLEAERDRPRADVFWSSEIFHTIRLAERGVLAPCSPLAAAGWPAEFRDPAGRWYGFAARARVIAFAPDRVPASDRPVTWMDLTADRFRGRIVMADPRFGTTGGHLAAMKAWWDAHVMPGYYEAFLEGLAANGVRLLPGGNAAVVAAVAEGQADLGLTDTDDVWAAQERGLAVDLIYPRHDVASDPAPGRGTLLIPNTVAQVAGAPHPAEALLLVDFLLSPEVERMLAASTAKNLPLRPALADEFPRNAVPDPLRVNYAAAAAVLDEAIDEAMRMLAGPGGGGGGPEGEGE